MTKYGSASATRKRGSGSDEELLENEKPKKGKNQWSSSKGQKPESSDKSKEKSVSSTKERDKTDTQDSLNEIKKSSTNSKAKNKMFTRSKGTVAQDKSVDILQMKDRV